MNNTKRFENKKVVVTGAGQGIGYGICLAFAKEGARVALNDLDHDLTHRAVTQINEFVESEQVYPYSGDVSDIASLTEWMHKFGCPDIVVANAGITRFVEFLKCTPDVFDSVVGVNLRGTYFTAQLGAQQMIDANIPGRIILISSVVGLRAFVNFSVYSMTKAAIQMMAKSLALELGSHKITVNAVSPGATLTERTQRDDPNYAENWASVNITDRVGYVDDISSMVMYLASDEASQITGQNIVIDGGWSIRSPLPADHPDMPVNRDQ